MLTLFRCLLRLYPAEFCREFAEEMTSVFCQGRRDVRHQGLKVRAQFLAREFWSMFTGALREQFSDDSFRRFDMRSFRFPRATIVVMLVALANVGYAIERAKQITDGGDTRSIWPPVLTGMFVGWLGVMGILGLIGYGILRVLKQSGAQRLSRIQTKPQL
jgi:hypothetical protein